MLFFLIFERLQKESMLDDVLVYRSTDMKTNFAVNGPRTCLPVEPPKIRFIDQMPSTLYKRSIIENAFWPKDHKLYRRDVGAAEEVVRKNRLHAFSYFIV